MSFRICSIYRISIYFYLKKPLHTPLHWDEIEIIIFFFILADSSLVELNADITKCCFRETFGSFAVNSRFERIQFYTKQSQFIDSPCFKELPVRKYRARKNICTTLRSLIESLILLVYQSLVCSKTQTVKIPGSE